MKLMIKNSNTNSNKTIMIMVDIVIFIAGSFVALAITVLVYAMRLAKRHKLFK